MAVNFTNLFTRIGKAGWLMKLVNEFRGQGTTAVIATDLVTEWEDFVELFDSDDDELESVAKPMFDALDNARNGLDSFLNSLKASVQEALIEIVHDDNPLPSKSLENALDELIKQMIANSQSVAANAVTLTVTPGGSNDGDGVLVASDLDGSGKELEYALSEDIEFTFTSTTTAGQEQATGRGEADEVDLLSQKYPTGSGCTVAVTANDAAIDDITTNGDFESFTVTDTPDNWTIVSGTAGTDLGESATAYKGSKALTLIDDTAEPHITQALTGLSSKTPYALAVWLRTITDTFASGDVIIDLYDGTSVINDEEGNANSLTVDLTTVTTSYVAHTAVFRLPEPVPATVLLRVRGSGILGGSTTAGATLLVDHLSMQEMVQCYNSGPYVSLFSGATNFSLDDTIQLDVANNEASAMQRLLERLLDLRSNERVIPSSGSPTQADSLIA